MTSKLFLERSSCKGKPNRRFTEHSPLNPAEIRPLRSDHPAAVNSRTIFPKTVVDPHDAPRLLIAGDNQRKVGGMVVKGPWGGMPIYTLTLEERATCPTHCAHWTTCYGNAMPWARRHRGGPDLEKLLELEVSRLSRTHPQGYVVRLHILGDFYSDHYTHLWHLWLTAYPQLHVFGYTANRRDSSIGMTIRQMNKTRGGRCKVRFSSQQWRGFAQPDSTTVIDRLPEDGPVPEGIVCPAQTGQTDCCGSCGLCWSPNAADKTIVFVRHGAKWKGRPKADIDGAVQGVLSL